MKTNLLVNGEEIVVHVCAEDHLGAENEERTKLMIVNSENHPEFWGSKTITEEQKTLWEKYKDAFVRGLELDVLTFHEGKMMGLSVPK